MNIVPRGAARMLLTGALIAAAALLAGPAAADDPHLLIKGHRFQPERLDVPAGVRFKLLVRNEDDSAEEFESTELNREKIIPPGKELPVFLGPLDKGEYKIFGDFHQDTAQGVLVAK
jgi:Cupredoxin-like domain